PALPGKSLARPALADLLAHTRAGRRVVLANGFFDLFHAGHVVLLAEAKKLGELLVVAINSDRSTRQNKGPGRPFLSEGERIQILSALECVDHVVVFDDFTPINLIRELRPDVLVKGGNYDADHVVGRDLVESWGGRVVVLPLHGTTTTSTLIRALQQASDGTRKE
ncbi:MAG: adenylyltransferase/cytidyltransferase family protein, partial [Planctomycetes bacterium]|nr:adenylyltransferase/cytidyltransferase family protein [Planctomycetota bacterium]